MIPAPQLDFAAVAPLVFVAVGAMGVLLAEVLLSRRRTLMGRPLTDSYVAGVLAAISTLALGLALVVSVEGFLSGGERVFQLSHPMIRLDRFANFAVAVVVLGSLLSVWLSVTYLAEVRINHGEYYALLLLASAGMILLVTAVDLLTVFLGLELMSIPIYVLAGFDRGKLRSNESSLKYFLIGSFASALLLYGMALLYGATGQTSFEGLREGFDPVNPLGLVGLGLVVCGFAFKISSVPFHQWTPDVYEGAPTSVTAYMSVTVKAAAFFALLRLLATSFVELEETLSGLLWVLAALTMIVGNLMAIIQENVKRMLAYSSIAHAGYVLIGFVAASPEGYASVLFYLLVYVFMNLGAFAVVVALAHGGRDRDRFEDYAGLARSRPGLAALMTLFMIALTGIPGTAGFMAKFGIFSAAIQAGYVGLTIIAVLTSVVSVYYYLRLPVLMYMREPSGEAVGHEPSMGELAVLTLCAFAVLFLGFFPNTGPDLLAGLGALDWARESAATLF